MAKRKKVEERTYVFRGTVEYHHAYLRVQATSPEEARVKAEGGDFEEDVSGNGASHWTVDRREPEIEP